MKIGIFGGTFNPPHLGHVALAQAAVKALSLDKLIVVPANMPPHKIPGSLADANARIEMCRLAFDGPVFSVSDVEIRREGISYTVDTLRYFSSEYPDAELFFIIGSDMLDGFRNWYRWEEILSLARLCVAGRVKGFKADLSCFTPAQRERITVLEVEPKVMSSTGIRIRIRSGLDCSDYLDDKVIKYCDERDIYEDGYGKYREILRGLLDESRFYHSECVSESAYNLAVRYGADPEKAKLAGLLHDITKCFKAQDQLSLIGDSITPLERSNYKVWHQMSGAEYIRRNKLTDDEEIISAVRWHTTGKADMTLLEKIVYTADFISAERDYPDVETVRKLAYISLEHAMLYTSRYTIKSLVALDRPVHPSTLDCYNDILKHFGL